MTEFKSKISRDYEAEKLIAGSFFSRNYLLFYFVSAGLAFVIILFIIFISVRGRARKNMYLVWFAFFGLLTLNIFSTGKVGAMSGFLARTVTETVCTGLGCGDLYKKSGLNIFINQSKYLKPNERFYLKGFARFFSAQNEPDNLKYEITFNGQKSDWSSTDPKDDKKLSNFGSRFIIGARRGDDMTYFIAPEKSGTYRMYLKVSHVKGWVGTKEGYIDFVVGSDSAVESVDTVVDEEKDLIDDKKDSLEETATSSPVNVSASG